MSGTAPRLRDALDRLPAYVAGRPPTGSSELPPYKLSSNENPYPPLPGVLEAIADGAAITNRYPDPASSALVDALAERHGVPREHLALGTGSVGLLQQVVQISAGPGDEVLFAWRSFEAYPIMTIIGGATAVQVPLRDDQTHDLDAMADAITERTRLIFVCTPNNPTGTVVTQAELDRFLERVPGRRPRHRRRGVRRVRPRPRRRARHRHLPRRGRTWRCCAPSPRPTGSRACASASRSPIPPVAHALRQTAVPFGVSTVAQVAAVASLAAEDALLERVDALVAERTRVEAALAAQGWVLPPSQANFVWLRLGDRIGEFVEACEAVNLSVRRYADDGVRVTIGETEANDRFLEVSARFV